MIFIFTYNRPGKLSQIIQHLRKHTNRKIVLIDDCSDFDIGMFENPGVSCYRRPNNGGKQKYFEQWNVALNIAKQSDAQTFVFMPDDFMEMDMNRIEQWIECMENDAWLFNLVFDGRLECFQPMPPHPLTINDENAWRVGFTDCGFVCNRKALELIKFNIVPIPESRWMNNPGMSSGVGQRLTNNLIGRCSMHMPKQSFAKHGTHESKMHPNERKKTPLISKH